MITTQTRIRLSEEATQYVNQLKEDRKEPTQTKIIEQIILEHKERSMNQDQLEYTTSMALDSINQKVEQEMHKHFKRLQLGVNNTDRNSQVLMELLIGSMVNNGIKDIMPTSEYEPTFVHTAKEEVNERIANLQQRKAEYEKKQNQS